MGPSEIQLLVVYMIRFAKQPPMSQGIFILAVQEERVCITHGHGQKEYLRVIQ